MPLNPRSFDDVYQIAKNRIQSRFPDADFNEGSFNDILVGSFALAYQELQGLVIERFSKTFFDNPLTTGTDLETLAVDHFGTGASRPQAQKAFGIITITRTDNTDDITIAQGQTFMSGEQEFVAVNAVTILTAQNTGNVFIEAREAGEAGNISSNTTNWESSGLDGVTITNINALQGGTAVATDEEYRAFIKQFIQSVQDGTSQGLEGTARLVNGVADARVIRKLVDVGTLDSSGALETGVDLFTFKAVRLILYVAGAVSAANQALLDIVRNRVSQQLSAGEFLDVQAARIAPIDITANLTFASSPEALQLAQDREQLTEAFKDYVNSLGIGVDFNVSNLQTNFASINGWGSLITNVVVSLPAGNVTIDADEKAVAGDITITVG